MPSRCLGPIWFCAVAAAQDPTPATAPAAPLPTLPALDDAAAKSALARFQEAMKGTPSMADKNSALQHLAQGAHKTFVKPLGRVVETDKSVVIRKRAAEILAQQTPKEARPELLRLLASSKVGDNAAVLAEVVRGVARCDYQRSDWEKIGSQFERDYAADRVPLQEAILDLVIQHKEQRAIDILLRNLDEPAPANVDDPTNPPAEYWEARWKAWRAWRGRVKEALFQITGQRFSTASEAKAWLRKNPLK